jgi:hypothetical protein
VRSSALRASRQALWKAQQPRSRAKAEAGLDISVPWEQDWILVCLRSDWILVCLGSDRILVCLGSGRAHTLPACGMATLCCSRTLLETAAPRFSALTQCPPHTHTHTHTRTHTRTCARRASRKSASSLAVGSSSNTASAPSAAAAAAAPGRGVSTGFLSREEGVEGGRTGLFSTSRP